MSRLTLREPIQRKDIYTYSAAVMGVANSLRGSRLRVKKKKTSDYDARANTYPKRLPLIARSPFVQFNFDIARIIDDGHDIFTLEYFCKISVYSPASAWGSKLPSNRNKNTRFLHPEWRVSLRMGELPSYL